MDEQLHPSGMSSVQNLQSVGPYEPRPIMYTNANELFSSSDPSAFTASVSSHTRQQLHQVPYLLQARQGVHLPKLDEELRQFWQTQTQEVSETRDFRSHSLPLARIKKIMKADEDVKMIAAETPVVFAKACEMFIRELMLRSWSQAEENKRRTLQKSDIVAAVNTTDVFDFLVDIMPADDVRDRMPVSLSGAQLGSQAHFPYSSYMAQQVGHSDIVNDRPTIDQCVIYSPHQEPFATQKMWSQDLQPSTPDS